MKADKNMLLRWRPRSLATKFNLLTIQLIIVTAIGIDFYVVRSQREDYYQRLINHGITVTETTANSIKDRVALKDRSTLNAAIQVLSTDADVAYLGILDRSGRYIVEQVFNHGLEVPHNPLADLRRVSRILYSDRRNSGDGELYLEFLYPILGSVNGTSDPVLDISDFGDTTVLGYLQLGLTQKGFRIQVRELLLSTMAFTVGLIVVGSILSLYLTRRITLPLKQLKTVSKELARGNYAFPLDIRTGDEIEELGSAFLDMSARLREYHDRLMHEARHDGLTGLPSRILFLDRLQHAVTHAKRRREFLFGVLFIDLDGFKIVNDSMGHSVGDKMLVEFGRLLMRCVRPDDTVARFGGDEFVVLLEDIGGEGSVIYVAQRIQEILARPLRVDDHDMYVAASIGIALSSGGYDFAEQVMRDADTAMYQAKASPTTNIMIFEPAMHVNAVARLTLETDMRRGIQQAEFTCHFQPIVTIKDRRILGFEALVRWHHAERGLLLPGDFISLAEETSMIIAIERIVLEQACSRLVDWTRRHPEKGPLFVSVNMSLKQLMQTDLVDYIQQVLARTGLPAKNLKLEITEKVVFNDPEAAIVILQRLRAIGVELYIDDFGTGYSSLSYLHRLPLHGLKIDRSFVKRLHETDQCRAIVKSILALARDLRFEVVAEGVETEDQQAWIRNMGCDVWQGYLYSRPLSAESAERLLA